MAFTICRTLLTAGLKLRGFQLSKCALNQRMTSGVPLHQQLHHPKLERFHPLCRAMSTDANEDDGNENDENDSGQKRKRTREIDPAKDRRIPVPFETSIRYLESRGFKETYGDDPVWKHYRRNHKGAFPPRKTRRKCIRRGFVSTGSPCPVCRDEYLIIDYRNTELLKHFISPYTGELYDVAKTGVCLAKQRELKVEIEKATDYGYITTQMPYREYDYSDYYDFEKNSNS